MGALVSFLGRPPFAPLAREDAALASLGCSLAPFFILPSAAAMGLATLCLHFAPGALDGGRGIADDEKTGAVLVIYLDDRAAILPEDEAIKIVPELEAGARQVLIVVAVRNEAWLVLTEAGTGGGDREQDVFVGGAHNAINLERFRFFAKRFI